MLLSCVITQLFAFTRPEQGWKEIHLKAIKKSQIERKHKNEMNYGERARPSSRPPYIIPAIQVEQRFRAPNRTQEWKEMMWDGLRKGSIYPVFMGDTGRKRNHLAKSQQPKLEITCPTSKLPSWSPFEYTSKAALFSTALFPAQACKGTKLRKWRNHLGASFLILGGLVGSNFPVVTEAPGDYKDYKEILTSDLDLEGFL